MKLHRIFIVIMIGCIALLGICAVRYNQIAGVTDNDYAIFENCFIQIEDEDDIFGELIEKTSEYNPGIYYEGTLLPYDKKNNRLYLPQNYKESEWCGKLTAVIDGENYPMYILRDEMMGKKEEAIRESHDFVLYVPVSEKEYYKFSMVITGMPLVSMTTEYEVEAEEVPYEEDPDKKYFGSETRYYGEFLMIDSGTRSGQHQIVEAELCYHFKGSSTAGFEKKSYSIDLLDYRGEKVNISLAGMRSDSTWKLNALCTDENRIREITASQIWELIDGANEDINESGPNMEYIELIVDNDYKGIYCLVEPIDAKKTNLQKDDILYKIIDWNIPDMEGILESVNNRWKIQYPVRIRYPKEINDYQRVWYPIADYLNIFYRGGEVSYEDAVKHVDLNNYCDMLIFTMAVSGSDNYYKNTYYVADCGNGIQNYQMKQIPWDLDYTFGNEYRYGAENNVVYNADWAKVCAEEALFLLYEKNPEEIAVVLNERWEKYRADFLDTEHIISLLEENREYLIRTGAVMREKERWPQSGVDMNIDYLKEFQVERMQWLDEYFRSRFSY